MEKDKLKIYFFELALIAFLFFTLFVPNIITRITLSIILVIFAIVCAKTLKKRNIVSIYAKQVTILMFLFSIVYIVSFYLMGLYFEYYQATVKFTLWSIINYIIPLTLIIISSEVIRGVFLAQKNKLTRILAFVAMVLIDLIVYSNIYDIATLEGFLRVIGFSTFSSISCNMLYNYISSRYGIKPIIIYRLITILYAYIIPIIPNVDMIFRSFLRMIYPYIIYKILDTAYDKKSFAISYKEQRKNIITTIILLLIGTIMIMLVSCRFRYGILVIGSESMTGTINKGDAVIFESYRGQDISDGTVIIFEQDDYKIVHRVVDKKIVNGQYRYFTKGDANKNIDEGYVTEDRIVGISKVRVLYIGYPSLWLNGIFNN